MSRGRTERVGLILALVLGTRAATAAETDVTMTCLELSAEDSAQVEARVRASLLSAGLTPTTLALSCEAAATQTQVTGNGQQVTMRAERSQTSLKDALLASTEAALSAWASAPTMGAPASPSPPLAAPAPEPEPTPPEVVDAPVMAPLTPPSAADTRPAVRSNPASYWIFAGPRAELWHSSWALGGQLGVQRAQASTFVAIRAGYLVNLPVSTQFSAHELQLGAELGYQPSGVLGLRGALGFGVSVFGATPAAGVSAQDGSDSSTLPCLSVELSRPIALGPLSLLPAIGVRAFARARSVSVDGQQVLALPALAAQASLSLALKLGG